MRRIVKTICWTFAGLVTISTALMLATGTDGHGHWAASPSAYNVATDPYYASVNCYYALPPLERAVFDKLSSSSQTELEPLGCQQKGNVLATLSTFRPELRDEVLARAIEQHLFFPPGTPRHRHHG